MADAPKRTRNLLIIAAIVLFVGMVGLGVGAWFRLDALMDRIDYSAKVVEVRPSRSCLDFLEGMGGLVDRVASKIGKLPFEIVFGGGGADAGADEGVSDAEVVADASSLEDEGGDASPDAPPEEESFDGEDCSAVVDVEVEIVNPMPIGATMRILSVDGTLSGEQITADQITWNRDPIEIEAGQTLTQRVTLDFHLGQLVAAGGGLLMRNSVSVVAHSVVEVSVLGGLVRRRLELHVERRLTLQEVVHGISGSVEPTTLPDGEENE